MRTGRMWVLAAVCALGVAASAQETIQYASLGGRVSDGADLAVAGAKVDVRAEDTGVTTSAATDGAGRFRFGYLQAGRYQVTVAGAGFATARRAVMLTMGAAFELPVRMTVGAQVAVNVEAEAPLLEADRSEISGTVSENEVNDLPYNGRSFLDLALLVPGVSPTNTAANQLFAETSAVGGQGLSVSSQRNFSNSYVVDGLSANDDAAGLVQASYGLDVIREMQVVTNGAQAEFGRALGGYISFLTRSGGSRTHALVYGYLRDKNLNARNALSGLQQPYTQVQAGASLSGPVPRLGKAFYFGNFERRQLNQTGIITITAANAAAINNVLAASNYPGQRLNVSATGPTTIYSNPVRAENYFFKLDDAVSARGNVSARYSAYNVSSVNSRGAGGTSATSAAAGLNDLDQTMAVSYVLGLTPRTANELRGQYTNSNLQAPVNDATGPAVSISGVAAFGTLSGSPTGRYDRLFEVVDNVSHQAGAHALRVGADFLFNDLTITFPMSNRGSYSYSSLLNFQKGVYSTFTQSFGNPVVPQTNPNVGVYAQDEWKVSRVLTVNAGLRYDLQFLRAVATDTNNVSPRIGFAYAPTHNGGTVVRGTAGLFYDRAPLRALSNALESDGNSTTIGANTFTTLALSYGQTGAPLFPNILTGYTATTLPANIRLSLSTLDPHLQNAVSLEAGLEVEQRMSAKSTLGLSYQHLRGEHLLADVNLNTPTCYATVDPVNLCRPNPAYANNKQYVSRGDSYYDGLAVSYVQRPARWGSYRVSYTWSKATDDVGEFFFSAPVNNNNLAEDRGLSDDDQRHRVVFDAVLQAPAETRGWWAHGWQLSGIMQYYSPLHSNVTTGQNSVQTTALRPCAPGYVLAPAAANTCANALPGTLIGRNQALGFDSWTMNARLSRTFQLGDRVRLQGIAEAFNALNHRNDQIPNGTFGTGAYPTLPNATFGQATAVGDPRGVQLAARLSF